MRNEAAKFPLHPISTAFHLTPQKRSKSLYHMVSGALRQCDPLIRLIYN